MARPTRSGKDQKKKRTNTLNKVLNKLKIRRLGNVNKRGRVVSTKKTGLSNIPAAEGMATVNRKARGLSNLPKDYKKQELKFSKTANKSTPTKNDTKVETNTNTKTGTKTKIGRAPKGYIKYGSKFVSVRTAQGKKALAKQKAKKRAQEMARKRLANK
jgi:hypothetical protein